VKTIINAFAALVIFSLLFFVPDRSMSKEKTEKTPLVNEFGKRTGTIEVKRFFKETSLDNTVILMNPEAVLRQVEEVLNYIQKYKKKDPMAVNAGIFSQLGITLSDVESTLRFLKDIIEEDMKRGTRFRLQDPGFLRKNFRIFQWFPYSRNHPGEEEIRITKYAIFTIKGSHRKNSVYQYALYGLPLDETGMSLEEAEKQKHRLCRFKYTKQQVLADAYDNGGASPLVWVTRQGLEEALMGGSVCVELPGGKKRYFNVDRNNGIAYDPAIKNPRDQARYWYFGQVPQPKGHGMDILSQIAIFPTAAFAGDIYNLGLGKLMGISYKNPGDNRQKMRLGILADTGGAFTPNLFQLDYYAGVFFSRRKFKRKVKTLPDFANVYILIKKRQPITDGFY
jgi:hypothetical protein